MVVGAAAGSGAMAMAQSSDQKEKSLVLACESYQDAERWTSAIEAQIADLDDTGAVSTTTAAVGAAEFLSRVPYRQRKHTPRPEVRIADVEEWVTNSKWKVFSVYEGVRLMQQVLPSEASNAIEGNGCYQEQFFSNGMSSLRGKSSGGGSSRSSNSGGGGGAGIPPCMRVNQSINASAADTFMSVFNFSAALRTGVINSIRIVENIDNYTDIIHLKLESVYIAPTWTGKKWY